jgi:hypothetical protein
VSGGIMKGAITFKEKLVKDCMTDAEDVFMINVMDRLNYKLISEIFKTGHSRIPVYARDRNDVVGILLTKDLIFVDPEDETPVKSFVDMFGRNVQTAWYAICLFSPIYTVFHLFIYPPVHPSCPFTHLVNSPTQFTLSVQSLSTRSLRSVHPSIVTLVVSALPFIL